MMHGHDVALWAAVASFFGSLLTISAVDILNPDRVVQYLAAIIVGLITGGAVYSKERLAEAKKKDKAADHSVR